MKDFKAATTIRTAMGVFVAKVWEMTADLGREPTPDELATALDIPLEAAHVLKDRAALPIGTPVDSDWAVALAALPAAKMRRFPDLGADDFLKGVDLNAIERKVRDALKKDQ